MPTLPIAVLVMVLVVPAVMALAWGRRLTATQGDPGLPERWLAYSGALSKVGVAFAFVLVTFGGALALPLLFLLPLTIAAGAYPARRRVFGESWELKAFLGHVLRFPIALLSFWGLVGAAPATIAALGDWQLPGAALIAAGLAIWSLGFGSFLRRLMGAREVEGPAISARFQQLLSRSEVLARGPRPLLLQAGTSGGIWAGHFGLPARRPFIVVGDVLLEKLNSDELAALVALDLAFIEHHQRAGRFGRELRGWLLTAGAVACVPLAARADLSLVALVPFFWFVITLLAFSRTYARHNQIVPRLDRRAVELSGDPEALVRALVKVHTLSNIPRRWDQDFERSASHPSLATRIQGIRQAAGFAPQTLDEEVVLESSEAGRYAILAPEQVWFLDGVAAGDTDAAALRQRATSSRAFAYRSLQGLHLKVGIGGAAVLSAATGDGQQVHVPLAPDSVARAQSALDAVDGKMAGKVAGRTVIEAVAAMAGVVLFIAALTPVIPGLVMVPALAVLRRRAVSPMLGAGAVGIVAGLLGLARAFCGPSCDAALLLGPALALVAGIPLLANAGRLARRAPQEIWQGYRDTVGVLTFGTAIALPISLILALEDGPSLGSLDLAGPAFALGLALVVFARYRTRLWARALGFLLLLAALAPAVLGSPLVQRLING